MAYNRHRALTTTSLPEGVLEDDGADRGIIFVFAEAHVGRQFEFVKTQRLNDGMLYAVRQLRKPILAAVNGTAHIDVG